MSKFCLYFFDHGGNIFGTDELQADDDDEAVQVAKTIFKCGIGGGYDIWQGIRHVHLEMNGQQSSHN